MAEEKLMRCPFCSGKAVPSSVDSPPRHPEDKDQTDYFIRCTSCGAEGGWAQMPGNAVKMWNMRADTDPTPSALKYAKPSTAGEHFLKRLCQLCKQYDAVLFARRDEKHNYVSLEIAAGTEKRIWTDFKRISENGPEHYSDV